MALFRAIETVRPSHKRLFTDPSRQEFARLFECIVPPHVDDLRRRWRRNRVPEIFR